MFTGWQRLFGVSGRCLSPPYLVIPEMGPETTCIPSICCPLELCPLPIAQEWREQQHRPRNKHKYSDWCWQKCHSKSTLRQGAFCRGINSNERQYRTSKGALPSGEKTSTWRSISCQYLCFPLSPTALLSFDLLHRMCCWYREEWTLRSKVPAIPTAILRVQS